MVGLLRSTLNPSGGAPEFDLETAHQLYAKLLQPVRSGWWSATSLVVVAHGALGHLPFTVLPTAPVTLRQSSETRFAEYKTVPWLARTHAIMTVPTVASMKTLWTTSVRQTERRPFAGFGNPYFSREQADRANQQVPRTLQIAGLSGDINLSLQWRALPNTEQLDKAQLARLPSLPETAEEIRSIASALKADPATDIFLGEKANEEMVKTTDLSDRRVVAFATHGLIPGDLDGLTQPALALTAPEVAGVAGDGLLTMDEILSLKLNADWVVLSACNTASGEGAGAEAVSGLGRAFFYAGTRALLVSHWPVETTSAKMLTTGVFRRQAEDPKLSRTEALQHTMLALMDGPGYVHSDTGKTVFSYAHPMFWAPFAIIGDGGPASGKRPVSAIGHVALTEAVPSATPQTSAAIVSRTMPGKPPTAHYTMLKNTNVREGPSTNSPKVTMLRKGTQITVLGEAPDGWYRIARGGRELGFVYGKLIAPLK